MGFAGAQPILGLQIGGSPKDCSRRAKHPVNPSVQKDFTFPNFGFMACPLHPGPAKGAFATVTTAGQVAADAAAPARIA
jgi:hypothetical protein